MKKTGNKGQELLHQLGASRGSHGHQEEIRNQGKAELSEAMHSQTSRRRRRRRRRLDLLLMKTFVLWKEVYQKIASKRVLHTSTSRIE